jgi:hypothetical protein
MLRVSRSNYCMFRVPVSRSHLLLLLYLLVVCAPVRAELLVPPERTLGGHTAAVMCVAFLPDGQTAVTGSRDRTVKLWDLKACRVIRTLEAHTGPVFALAVSPDGAHVASTGADCAVRVWEVKSGKMVALLEGHTGNAIGLKYLPNGQLLSAAGDGLRLWDVEQEKLIWKGGVGVSEFDASADGKIAVVTDFNNGVHEVWDIPKRTSIRTFGNPSRMRPGLAITPDGAEIYGHDSADRNPLRRWNTATGKETLVNDRAYFVERVAVSPDASLIVTSSAFGQGQYSPAIVWDAKSAQPIRYLQGPREFSETLLAFAFSPDGKTLLATSGVYMPQSEGVRKLATNQLLIYDLSDIRSPQPTGVKAGKLSWQEVPLKIRMKDGRTIDLPEFKPPITDPIMPARRYSGGDGRDILLTNESIFFQRTPDRIDQVMTEPRAMYGSAVWDGLYAWITSRTANTLIVLDGEGQLVAKIGLPQGLPPSEAALEIYPLAEGRVLAAGAAGTHDPVKGSGWCGVVDLHADANASSPPRVDVLVKEAQLPESWSASWGDTRSALVPIWMVPGPPPPSDAAAAATKPHRLIWVACESTRTAEVPILRVDPEARTFDTYNIGAPGQSRAPLHRPVYLTANLYWLSPDELLYNSGGILRAKVGPTFVDSADRKLVIQTSWLNTFSSGTPFLPIAGQLYVPGERWQRIDPRSLEVEDIGPGFRFGGEIIKREISHFNSGIYGPIAILNESGRVFRLSVDPAHPLAVAATLDAPMGRPLPAAGAVEFRDGLTLFYCGDGALEFADGLLRPNRTIGYPYLNPRADLDAQAMRTRASVARVGRYPSEKERVGLSDEQWNRARAHPEIPVTVDSAKLNELFATWAKAPDGPAKDAATRALFAEAKAIGARDTQAQRAFVDGFKAIFTPRQWQLFNYEVVGN